MGESNIEIVPFDDDLADGFVDAASVAFSFDADGDERQRIIRSFEPRRFIAPVEDGRVVGSAGQLSYRVTVPGGAQLDTGGVTFVTMLPTHRRRGTLRRMMQWLLADAREREEPLSALWASEATIYGRFGFGQAVASFDWKLDGKRASWRVEPGAGSARLVDVDTARSTVRGVHDAACRRRHGMFQRSQHLWDDFVFVDEEWMRRGHTKRRIVLWDGDGDVEGYAFFRTKEGEGPEAGSVRVTEMHALTDDAYRGLVRFMADIDLTDEVTFHTRPGDEPLRWLLEDSRAVTAQERGHVWFRLVDLPAALAARTYEENGAIVLGVNDGFAQENTGTWKLEVDAGHATCVRVTSEADVTLDAADLGAISMGGRSVLPLAAAGRIAGDHDAALRLDRMFRTQVPPWSPEHF